MVITRLMDADPKVVGSTCKLLMSLPAEKLTPYKRQLIGLLTHEQAEVVKSTFELLKSLPTEELAACKEQLVGLLTHEQAVVVDSAMKLLIALPAQELEKCKGLLAELLTHEQADVVKSVVKLLMALPIAELAAYKEQLVGLLTVTGTSEKQLRRLLTLLELYKNVDDAVRSYGDMTLVDVLDSGNSMTGQVADFQRLCEKLPKPLQIWQAYDDLKLKIKGLVEIVPLLQLLSNKAMRQQHWATVEKLVEIKFDTIEETSKVRHLVDLQDEKAMVRMTLECKTTFVRDTKTFKQSVKEFRAGYEKRNFEHRNFGLQLTDRVTDAIERLERTEREFSDLDRYLHLCISLRN